MILIILRIQVQCEFQDTMSITLFHRQVAMTIQALYMNVEQVPLVINQVHKMIHKHLQEYQVQQVESTKDENHL